MPEMDFTKNDKGKNEIALVLMVHGTDHFADAAYAALDYIENIHLKK